MEIQSKMFALLGAENSHFFRSMFNIIATMILFNEGTQNEQKFHRFTVQAILQKISITFRLTFSIFPKFLIKEI